MIPVPLSRGGWPLLGHLPRFITDANPLLTYTKLHQECGDRVRIQLPGMGQVVLTREPQDAKVVMMNQGPFPFRTDLWVWDRIFKQRGWPVGIPWADGEQWKIYRKVLNNTLFQLGTSVKYANQVVPKANRLVQAIEKHLDKDGICQQDLKKLYGLFALEAVVKVVMGKDLNLILEDQLPPDAIKFVKSVEDMFAKTRDAEHNPLSRWVDTKQFAECRNCWDTMWNYASNIVNAELDPYLKSKTWPAHLSKDQTILPLLVEQMEKGELTKEELISIGVQAIAAAVDTTSQTLEYLVYNLGRNPGFQDDLFKEIITTFSEKSVIDSISEEEYDSLKLTKAALKESMRFTPTIGMHVRKLKQDAILGDKYIVPAGDHVMINYLSMSQNEEIFKNAKVFDPYRFLRSEQSKAALSYHPFAAIPFGHGARKCAGAGFAQMDIHLATICLMKRFKVEYSGPELQVVEQSLLRPTHQMSPHFVFSKRS
jgi:cytochrome P450